MTTLRKYLRTIPRRRAIAALDLANALLDYEDDLEPHGSDGDVEVFSETWAQWLALARRAAAVKTKARSS